MGRDLSTLAASLCGTKPWFDGYMRQVVGDHNDKEVGSPSNMALKLMLPSTLKDIVRACEKALLVADPHQVRWSST